MYEITQCQKNSETRRESESVIVCRINGRDYQNANH